MSYRITINGEPFCSSEFEHSAVLDPKVTLEVNKDGSLVFTILPDHPYYNSIEFRQSIFDVYLDNELIWEGIPVSEATDFWNRKVVTCEGELTFLNDTIQRQAVYQNQTVASLLGEYLTVHNAQADATKQFTVGSVTVSGGNSIYRYTNYQSTMTELQEDLIQNFGGYFRIRHSGGVRYLDYLASSPHNSSQTVRVGKNLVDLSQNLSSLDICTVLIPLGAKTGNQVIDGLDERLDIKSVNSNLDYLVGTAQAYYGNVWKTQIWDDVTTASALKQKGQDYLNDAQWANLVIEATAFDLGLATEDVEQFHVLDMIRVVSEPHGIDRLFMLTKLEIDLDHPANTKITLGQDTRLSLSARTAKNATEIERQETTIMVNASENARQILDAATDGAIQILYNQDGVAYEMRINNSQNPDTATAYWRYNSGGWGYYDKTTDTYITAATMDGVIFANLIKAGILSSDNGLYWLNMASGEMKMKSGEIGDWKVSSNGKALYNDVVDPNNSDIIYRVYLQPPLTTNPTNTWVLSCQKSTNGGSSFSGAFVLYSDGSVRFGSGTTTISDSGQVAIRGGTDANANLKVIDANNPDYYLSLSPGTIGIHAEAYEARWVGPLLEVSKNNGSTVYGGTPEWGISRLSLKLAGGYGGNDPDNPFYQVYLDSYGLTLKDYNGTIRCKLETTGGLSFYDSSGNIITTYMPTITGTW